MEVNENNLHTISHIQYLAFKADDKIKRPFTEKVGDWVCFCCKNLNFSFRSNCNRCDISKLENAKIGLEISRVEKENNITKNNNSNNYNITDDNKNNNNSCNENINL